MNTKYSGHTAPRAQERVNSSREKAVRKRPKQQMKTVVRKSSKTQKKMNPLGLFFMTFGGIVLAGAVVIVCICLPKYLKLHNNEEVNFASFVEAIPETIVAPPEEAEVEETEVLGASKPKEKYSEVIEDAEYLRQNNIFVQKGKEEGVVSMNFTGDILFDDEYCCMCSLILRGGDMSTCISPETLLKMQTADITVVNNEFPYTERGTRNPEKMYSFRAEPDTAGYLKDLGADVAILANNHVYDYGQQGLVDTLDTLNAYGVHPVGAGKNLTEAITPVYYIINDIKVAIIAATQIERLDTPNTIGATQDKPGVFRCWANQLIYDSIRAAKENADFVVVCVHWGTEKDEQPDYWQTEMAPKLAEAGADLIIGDHTHRLQGIYYYGDTPCIYSLGNFWFNGSTIDTGMVEVKIDKEGLKSFQFLPAIQSNYSTKLVEGSEQTRIINYLRSLSHGAVISDDGFVQKNS